MNNENKEKKIDFEVADDSILATNDNQTQSEVNNDEVSENKIVKYFKSLIPTLIIALGSFFLVFLLHYFGSFDVLELKLYDFRFKIRGPLSGND